MWRSWLAHHVRDVGVGSGVRVTSSRQKRLLIGSLFCREKVTLRSERRFRFASLRTPTPSTCTSAHLPKVRRFPAFPSHLPKVGFSIMHLTASASAFLLPPGLFHLPKLRRFPAFSSHLPKVGFSCREEVTLIFRTGRCSPPSKLLARTRKNRRHGVCWEELGSQCVKVEGCGSWRFLTGPVHGVSL